MRTKVKATPPELVLTRLLEALGEELIEASDEELLAAAAELGMKPMMKGSAAFMGLKFSSVPRLSDYFDLEVRTLIAPPEKHHPDE
jgi:hypothetical protein